MSKRSIRRNITKKFKKQMDVRVKEQRQLEQIKQQDVEESAPAAGEETTTGNRTDTLKDLGVEVKGGGKIWGL